MKGNCWQLNKMRGRLFHLAGSRLIDSTRIEGLVKDRYGNDALQHSSVVFVAKDGKKARYYPNQLFGYGNTIYIYTSGGGAFHKRIQTGRNAELYILNSVSSWSAPAAGPGMTPMHFYS